VGQGGAVVRSFPIPVPHSDPPSAPPTTTTPSAPAAIRIQPHVLSPRAGGGGGGGGGRCGGGGGGEGGGVMGGGYGGDSDVLLQWWLGPGQSKVVRGGKKTVHYSAFRRGKKSHKFSI